MAVAVVAVTVLAACSPQRVVGADDDVPPPPATAEAPLPTVVGLQGDAVVQVDPGSGAVVVEHVVEGDGELVDLELVRVRGSAVVTRRTDAGAELLEVRLDSGVARVIGDGERPAVTADGSRLAFVRQAEDPDREHVVAATWEGTELRVWPIAESGSEHVAVHGIAWAGTGEELAVTLDVSGVPEVVVLPVDRTGTLRGAGESVPATSVGAVLRSATFREPGRLTLAEGCCGDDHDRWRVVDMTVHTWGAAELVGDLAAAVRHLDWSVDGHHLLLTLDTTPPRVVRWQPGERVDVVEGLVSAEW